MGEVILPWPPSKLSPNHRCHWGQKSDARKKYRSDCYMLTPRVAFLDGKISLEIIFHPPSRRKADIDNMLASFKSGLDSLAEKWGVDDSRFRLAIEKGDPVKFGQVVIRWIE